MRIQQRLHRCRLHQAFSSVLLAWVAATGVRASEPEQLTTGPGNDTEARYAPDGKTVVFQSDRTGTQDLYALDVTTKEIRPLTTTPGHACFPTFSRDGKWIVYSYAHFTRTALERQEHGYNLFVIPADGRGEARRLTGGLQRDYLAEFTPDGKNIYFASTRAADARYSGSLPPTMLYSVPFAGGDPEPALQRNSGHMVQPTFSPDGSYLAYGIIEGFDRLWQIRVSRLKRLVDYAINTPGKPRNLWDLSADFSLDANPNGQWSYCYASHVRESVNAGGPSPAKSPPDTSDAVLMPKNIPATKNESSLDAWHNEKDGLHLASIGVALRAGKSGEPYYSVYEPGHVGVMPGGQFRGGTASTLAIARWTAPRDGDIVVLTNYEGTADGDRDFYLIHNHTNVLVEEYSFRHTKRVDRRRITVKAGDTIDLCTGRGVQIPSSVGKIDKTIYYADQVSDDETGLKKPGEYLPNNHHEDTIVNTDGRETFYAPRWSPTGNVVACTGYRFGDESWQVYTVDLETGEKKRLTNDPDGNCRSPSWSPDAKTLVFEGKKSGLYKLYRVESGL